MADIGKVVKLDDDIYVLRVSNKDKLKEFLEGFGLKFKLEKHGSGPEHWAAETFNPHGVLEIYPIKKTS